MSKKRKEITLSVCLTCTLNKDQNNNKLAGEKLAQKLKVLLGLVIHHIW